MDALRFGHTSSSLDADRPPVSAARTRLDAALAEAVQRTGDGAFVTGVDGRILLWNRAAERMLGFAARDVVSRKCCNVFGGFDAAGNRLCYPGCHIQALVRRAEPVASYDMQTRSKAGTPVWLNVSVLPLPPNGDGAPVTLHLFRDVTASRELLALVRERGTDARGDRTDPATALDLTRRELEILRLLVQGLGTAAIVERLHVSRATVRNHLQNIFAKLGVHSRVAAVAYANAHRLF